MILVACGTDELTKSWQMKCQGITYSECSLKRLRFGEHPSGRIPCAIYGQQGITFASHWHSTFAFESAVDFFLPDHQSKESHVTEHSTSEKTKDAAQT